eukprot:1914350-Rhodomonas_salina.1
MLHPTQHGGGMKRSASQVFRPKVQENSGKEQVKMSASEPGEPTKEVTLEDSERRRVESARNPPIRSRVASARIGLPISRKMIMDVLVWFRIKRSMQKQESLS